MFNDVLTIENNSVIIGGTRVDAATDNLLEVNISTTFTNNVTCRSTDLHYEWHPLSLYSGVTASSTWSAANEPIEGGLYYIVENANHIIIAGCISFTPNDYESGALNVAYGIPIKYRPERICFNICPGNCDAGTGLTNNRLLKMYVNPNGVIGCGASSIPGGTLSTTQITKCAIYIEYWI